MWVISEAGPKWKVVGIIICVVNKPALLNE
jgi:hypothetical protein